MSRVIKNKDNLHGPLWVMACLLLLSFQLHAEWKVDALMSQLAAIPRSTIDFTESRTSAFLQQPLLSYGTLSMDSNGRLVKETQQPGWQRLVVDSHSITIQYGDPENPGETIPLDDKPQLQSLIAAFRALLTGDLARLQQHYKLQLEGDEKNWQLLMTPRELSFSQQIQEIAATGNGGEVKRFEIIESDGDSTMMELGATSP